MRLPPSACTLVFVPTSPFVSHALPRFPSPSDPPSTDVATSFSGLAAWSPPLDPSFAHWLSALIRPSCPRRPCLTFPSPFPRPCTRLHTRILPAHAVVQSVGSPPHLCPRPFAVTGAHDTDAIVPRLSSLYRSLLSKPSQRHQLRCIDGVAQLLATSALVADLVPSAPLSARPTQRLFSSFMFPRSPDHMRN